MISKSKSGRNTYLFSLAILVLLCGFSAAQQAAPADAKAERVTVLNDFSSWRMFHLLRPPVVDVDGKAELHRLGTDWLNSETPQPPAGWNQTKFDDSTWLRTTARGGCQTPLLARQYIRGKFYVLDPEAVTDLSLSLAYHGGAIVYLNGREIARRHLPQGDINQDSLAEAYPLESYVTQSGDFIAVPGTYIARGRKATSIDADSKARVAGRVRRLDNLKITSGLVKGVNVIAIELLRAPYHKVMLESAEQADGKLRLNAFDWGTCQLMGIGLSADGDAGLRAVPGRPDGLQVFNSDMLEAVSTFAFGDPWEPMRPVRLVGARNGVFSGKFVVSSDQPLVGLSVQPGELRSASGHNIAASSITIGYGQPWGVESGFNSGEGPILSPYPQSVSFFGAVGHVAPAEVPVSPARPPLRPGAVLPVWLSVRTAADTPPGLYKGSILVTVENQKPRTVEVELQVTDCLLPGSDNQRTWVELIQAPEVLSVEYDAELWSDRHFELIGQSLRLIRDSGTRIVYVPAIGHTNIGNMESMIRWIKKPDGSYEWDFSVMDRYLDLVQKELGEPKLVVLQVWEIYMSTRESVAKRFAPELEERHEATGGRPMVTVLDRATGKTENMTVPGPGEPQAKAIWQALLSQVQARLKERGLDDRLMLGMFTDAVPPKEHMQFFHDIDPNLPWVQQGHGRWTTKVHGIAEVGYQATVWGGFRFADGQRQTNQKGAPIVRSLHGWKEPRLDVVFERNLGLDSYPSTRWMFYPETAITGELRGIGRIGADYWKVIKDRRGRRSSYAHDRYNEGAWGGNWINLNLCSSTLAPGPQGPIMTTRLLALIEGVQETEARIIIEQALTDETLKQRLGSDLASRCQTHLDQRLHNMWKSLSNLQLSGVFFFKAGAWRWTPGITGHRWYMGSDWQSQVAELYELAAEVQKKLAK